MGNYLRYGQRSHIVHSHSQAPPYIDKNVNTHIVINRDVWERANRDAASLEKFYRTKDGQIPYQKICAIDNALNKLLSLDKFDDEHIDKVVESVVFAEIRVRECDYLTADELQALYEMPLTGLEAEVRDVFLIGCYTCQRFSDYSVLQPDNFTTTSRKTKIVRLIQQKTNTPVVAPILNDNLLRIAERYDFEIPVVSDVILNRYIKLILKRFSESVPSLAEIEITKLAMKEPKKKLAAK